MIKTEDGRVEIKGDYADLISDFGCIARSIGRNQNADGSRKHNTGSAKK